MMSVALAEINTADTKTATVATENDSLLGKRRVFGVNCCFGRTPVGALLVISVKRPRTAPIINVANTMAKPQENVIKDQGGETISKKAATTNKTLIPSLNLGNFSYTIRATAKIMMKTGPITSLYGVKITNRAVIMRH